MRAVRETFLISAHFHESLIGGFYMRAHYGQMLMCELARVRQAELEWSEAIRIVKRERRWVKGGPAWHRDIRMK
jgi:hypothetical protein